MISPFVIKIIGVVLIIVSALGYFMYSQKKIQSLTQDNALYKISLDQTKQVVQTLKDNNTKQQKQVSDLSKNLNALEIKNSKIKKMLSDHDLHSLAFSKPGLVEKKINDGTQELFNDFETITSN